MCREMEQDLNQLETLEKEAENEEEKKFLATYLKILKQIGQEVLQAQVKYKNVNREQMIQERKNNLNNEIHIFREYQKQANRELKEINDKIKEVQKKNVIVEF